MLKDLLITFFVCLVIGSVINGGGVKGPSGAPPAQEAAEVVSPAPETTDSDFAEDVLNAKQPVLVDFSTGWCGACQKMAPLVDQLAEEYRGKAGVFTVDADMNPIVRAKYGVEAYPTFVIFKDGQPVWKDSGARGKDELASELDKLL